MSISNLVLNEPQAWGELIVVVVVLYLVWKYPWSYYFSVLNEYPGPPSTSWLTGANSEIFNNKSWEVGNFPNPIIPWIQKFGEVIRFRAFGFSHRLLIADPDALKYFLVTNASNYPRSTLVQKIITAFTGEAGLFGTEGSAHLKQRKLLNPHFSHSHIKEFTGIFEHHVGILTKQFDKAIAEGTSELSLNKKFTELTLDIIGFSAFGYKFDSINQSGNDVQQAYNTLMKKNSPLHTLALASIPGYQHLPFESLINRKNALKVVNDAVESIIYAKINQKHSSFLEKDLLDLMLDSVIAEKDVSKQKEAIEEVKSHVLTFLLAGHETTSTAFCWFFVFISQHPKVQSKIREECQGILKDTNGEIITMKQVSLLKYLTACIHETMRLFPSVAGVAARCALNDDTLPTVSGEKIKVPAGTVLHVSIVGIHRNPKYWTKADEFHPERFIEGSNLYESDVKLRGGRSRTFFFMPFSTGSKNCIGSRFAIAELQIILSNLLARFSFALCKDANVNPLLKNIAFTPKNLKVTVSRADQIVNLV